MKTCILIKEFLLLGDDFIATDNLVELMQLLDMETDSE